MNNQWSDNLRRKMEVHEEPSPNGLWEDIEQIVSKGVSLQGGKRPVQSLPGQNTMLLWGKRIGAVAAILVVLFFIGDFFLKENTPHSPVTIQGPDETRHKRENSLSIDQNNKEILFTEAAKGQHEYLAPENNTVTFSALPPATSVDKKKNDSPQDKKKDEINKEGDEPNKSDLSEHPEKKSDIAEKNTDIYSASRDRNHDYQMPESTTHYPIITRQNKTARWQTSLYTSNTSSGSSKTYNGYRSFLSEKITVKEGNASPLLIKNPYEGIMIANKQNMVYTDAKHRQPVTIGASIKYNFDDKWSITSGLTYTLLSSEIRSGSDNYYYFSEQTLHNIGIPLDIHYNLWRGRNASIYLSGGGMMEKNVAGKLVTDYVVNGKLDSTEKDHISLNRLQWSVNTSAGVEYNLFSKIGLYAEPGITYYFENGDGIETIYKEKPLNFNLRVGLRFSLSE
ncbi:porin family protein [Proteiniphilum sp. UBA5384]|uniref:porin family protein n=1 Tax=Proteiniphilum sp. UBA5384 TaxID=1947279 RepID=UPI0025F21D94|nr:porin family protein [Proteiniphilum sp. UBA5384]